MFSIKWSEGKTTIGTIEELLIRPIVGTIDAIAAFVFFLIGSEII